MVRGVATVAERNQVRGVIVSAAGARNKVVNISFARFTCLTARPTNMAVASKNNIPDLTPALVLLTRVVGC